MKLDARDIAILRVLSTEGRIAKTALAERVGLSPTPCWDRMRRLEQAGLIEGYRAEIALKKLGPHVTVFVAAELADHTAARFRSFEDAMQRYDEVVACWALGGGFDYLLQIVTRDIDAYQRFIDTMLDARIGLARYFTYIVTKPVKGRVAAAVRGVAGRRVNLPAIRRGCQRIPLQRDRENSRFHPRAAAILAVSQEERTMTATALSARADIADKRLVRVLRLCRRQVARRRVRRDLPGHRSGDGRHLGRRGEAVGRRGGGRRGRRAGAPSPAGRDACRRTAPGCCAAGSRRSRPTARTSPGS